MMGFLRKLFGSRSQPTVPETIELRAIPDDLRQAATALIQTVSSTTEGSFLAYLSPDRIRIDSYAKHDLNTEDLLPEHVLACWVWQENRWQPSEAADFLAQRDQEGTSWTEFALRMKSDHQAVAVWQRLYQVIQDRCGGAGGTMMLEHTSAGWVKSDHSPEEAWII